MSTSELAPAGEGREEILVSARTLRQAIDYARIYWRTEGRHLHVETIREPKAGWLGFGRREGLFRVVRTPANEATSLEAQLARLLVTRETAVDAAATEIERETGRAGLSDLGGGGEVPPDFRRMRASSLMPGQARVRDGRLEIRGAALVIAPDGVDLYVNGHLRHGTTMVREADEVRVELSVATPPEGFAVSVTPDEMAALLELHAGSVLRLRDASPARPLLLEVEEVRLPPRGLSEEAVREELSRMGVVHGIDLDAIERAVREMPATPVVVAQGTPAQPGRPTHAEFLFGKSFERRAVIRDDDSVDYRGVLHVPFVEAGDLLVRKITGDPGQPGRTVRGRELPAPRAEVILLAGRGASLDEDGFAVRAVASGRPQVEENAPGRYLIRVVPVLRHGTVDLSSGNLTFGGDIVIQGNVEESMSVVAGGDVTIYGTVSKAYIEAGGHLSVIGNSFNSTLVAGGRAAFFAAEQNLLERLVATLDKLRHAIEQVQNHPASSELTQDRARFGLLVRLLVQMHVRELPDLVRLLSARLSSNDRHDDLSDGLRALVSRHFIPHQGVSFGERTEIEAFRLMLLEAIALARAAPRDRADVRLRYVHNCRVEALGSIRVAGEGSYYSDFYAGERFRSAGPVRGGRVFGKNGVEVSEAGSDMDATTELVTSELGTIRAGRVFPGVILRVGRRGRKVDDVREGVVERMDGQEPLLRPPAWPRELGRHSDPPPEERSKEGAPR